MMIWKLKDELLDLVFYSRQKQYNEPQEAANRLDSIAPPLAYLIALLRS